MKRAIIWALALSGFAFSSSAFAETCTASGHPSCTITCPAGCIALYWEPNGPCRPMCSGSAVKGSPIASDVRGLTASEVQKLLKSKK
jgi:hypothetical protein